MTSLFVTGTDTGVGKTVVCGLLAGYLRDAGRRVVTQKWIQTGADRDLEAHARWAGGVEPDWAQYAAERCPALYDLAASPHLAARQAGRPLDASVLLAAWRRLTRAFDVVLVEGSGGLLVPFDDEGLVVDPVVSLDLPVLVVVADRLGAINHSLLTLEALRARGLRVLGLIFNTVPGQETAVIGDNARIVARHGGVPVLGHLPYGPDVAALRRAFEPMGRALVERWQGRQETQP